MGLDKFRGAEAPGDYKTIMGALGKSSCAVEVSVTSGIMGALGRHSFVGELFAIKTIFKGFHSAAEFKIIILYSDDTTYVLLKCFWFK